MRIAVNGCTGRIGALLCRALMKEETSGGNTLSGGVSRHRPPCIDFAWSERLSGLPECDAVADFSSRECTKDVLSFCLSRRLPLLIGTTGQTEEELSRYFSLLISHPEWPRSQNTQLTRRASSPRGT